MENKVNLVSLTLKQRVDIIKTFCLCSNIDFISQGESDVKRFNKFVLNVDGKEIALHCVLKNVVNSGWANKPYIKRIQIASLRNEKMHFNQNNVYSWLVGFVFVDNEPYICVWNPFRFTFHNTVRSCYVWDETLIRTKNEKNGFFRTIDSKKELLICDRYHFKELIKEFIDRNDIG